MKITSPFKLGIKAFCSYLASAIIATIAILVVMSISEAAWAKVLGQLLALFIVGCSVYTCIWRDGSSDYNRVKFGHMKYDKYKGLRAGLCAAIPQLVMWLAMIVCKLIHVNFAPAYKIFNFYLMNFLNWLFGDIGMTIETISMGNILLSGITLLIIPAAAFPAYIIGYRQFSVSEQLIYKNLKKKPAKNSSGTGASSNRKTK